MKRNMYFVYFIKNAPFINMTGVFDVLAMIGTNAILLFKNIIIKSPMTN